MELVESKKVENIICESVQEKEIEEIVCNIIPGMIELIQRIERETQGECAGLAAPQIGIKKKFFIRWSGVGRYYNGYTKKEEIRLHYILYFNSVYKEITNKKIISSEGCFSYQFGSKKRDVTRYKRIKLFTEMWDYEQRKLVEVKKKLSGYEAIIIQHEIDHHGNGEGQLSKTIFCR